MSKLSLIPVVVVAFACLQVITILRVGRSWGAYAQQQSTSGQTTGSGCSPSSGTCATDGSSNYVTRSLTFDTTTGIYTGTMTFNLCPNNGYGKVNGAFAGGSTSADCKQQTFPAPAYTASKTPAAAPLLGVVGYSMFGVNIFGPFENGFSTGFACSNSKGDCVKGVDLQSCENELKFECGEANVKKVVLGDDCGGHANPYHFHTYLACDAATNAKSMLSATHSPLVGIALDGRGIYGKYESGTTAPTDLDACGGHYGPVPGTNLSGAAHNGASNVYHYHTQDVPPFMIGCYGPVSSVTACRNLYSRTCGSGYETVTSATGVQSQYDTDCPCWSSSSSNSSNLTTSTTPATSVTSGTAPKTTTTTLPPPTSSTMAKEVNVTTTTTRGPAASLGFHRTTSVVLVTSLVTLLMTLV